MANTSTLATTPLTVWFDGMRYGHVVLWVEDGGIDDCRQIRCISVEEGIVTIEPCNYLRETAELVTKCLDRNSNFRSEVLKAYNFGENDIIKGIRFTHNGTTLTVTEGNAGINKIVKAWEKKDARIKAAYKAKYNAWLTTPEGREMEALEEELKVAKRVEWEASQKVAKIKEKLEPLKEAYQEFVADVQTD